AVRLKQPTAREAILGRLRDAGKAPRKGRGVTDWAVIPLWAIGQLADSSARQLVQSVCTNWEGMEGFYPRETQLCLQVLHQLGEGQSAAPAKSLALEGGQQPGVRDEVPAPARSNDSGSTASITGTWRQSGPATLTLNLTEQDGGGVTGTAVS